MVTRCAVRQSLSGILESDDCRSPPFGPTYFVDRYSFSGVAGEEVVVQVASTEILPEIALLHPSGYVLAYGYSGTGLARLPGSGAVTLPEDGVYIIEVAGVGAVDQTGHYSVTL